MGWRSARLTRGEDADVAIMDGAGADFLIARNLVKPDSRMPLAESFIGMVVRAGMRDRETVGLLGIHIERRFTIVFGIAVVVAGIAGAMYTPIVSPNYRIGMDFLVLSFVVVVVGGMGSLPGAVASGFLLGILQSFASMNEVKQLIPGIDQVIVYLVAVVILLTRPRGLLGRKGVMED